MSLYSIIHIYLAMTLQLDMHILLR